MCFLFSQYISLLTYYFNILMLSNFYLVLTYSF
ncbi:hypothetical protein BE24_0054 [Staphylococcus phage vB_SepM_BE24]|nr:hypothetical protein BE24_0054 [Staphylococcus phage vB_SepM_BE24]